MKKICISGALFLAVGCGDGSGAGDIPIETGSVSQADTIGVTLAGVPGDVDCISFTLTKEDGTVQDAQFSLTGPRILRIRNVGVGAYELSAVAYSSGLNPPISDAACAAVPLNAPWATEAPVPVIVQRGQPTQVSITLVPAGRIVITPNFFEAPEVIASGQGPVSFIAANGNFVAWVVKKQDTEPGVVMSLDTGVGTPSLVAGDQTNPAQILVAPPTNTVFWENLPSLARDQDGNFINDGSIWSSTGGELRTGLDPTDLGFATANSTFYWGERSSATIECEPCSVPFATGEPGANTLTAIANHVFWSVSASSVALIRAKDVTEATPRTLADTAPRDAYGMAADSQSLYFIDSERFGDIDDSTISKMPLGGGPITPLVEHTLAAFPIAVFKGFVYYVDVLGVHRVPVNTGAPEDVATGTIKGFALTTDAAGHDVMYWTDPTHGGLIWRGRLN
jgi:hypothetical protein